MYTVEIIPCLSDNYAYVIVNNDDKTAIVVDVPEFDAIDSFLFDNYLTLESILLTHHHGDHTSGVAELVEKTNAKVYGNGADKNRLPNLDVELTAGQNYNISGLSFDVIKSDGHTIGCISFYIPEIKSVFTGDLLFTMGCGRMFEGSYDVFFDSLSAIKQLPTDTLIYSGHEYTNSNIAFADTVIEMKPDYKAQLMDKINNNIPTVPASLGDELKNNPFLIADTVDKFATVRKAKDSF